MQFDGTWHWGQKLSNKFEMFTKVIDQHAGESPFRDLLAEARQTASPSDRQTNTERDASHASLMKATMDSDDRSSNERARTSPK